MFSASLDLELLASFRQRAMQDSRASTMTKAGPAKPAINFSIDAIMATNRPSNDTSCGTRSSPPITSFSVNAGKLCFRSKQTCCVSL